MTFDEIGLKHLTDKSSMYHGYMGHYERYLSGKDVRNVLEIGVAGGESMRMWCEIFPNANIVGIDIDVTARRHANKRVGIWIMDQTDRKAMQSLVSFAPAFDLIVDDGSHLIPDVMMTLPYLFQALAPGGVYVIEDMYCNAFDEEVKTPKDWVKMEMVWTGFCSLLMNFAKNHPEIESIQVVKSQTVKGTVDGQCLALIKKK